MRFANAKGFKALAQAQARNRSEALAADYAKALAARSRREAGNHTTSFLHHVNA